VFEHASDANGAILIVVIALMMIVAGMAKKQLVWRPRTRSRSLSASIRRWKRTR
jgi:hypothetical protein